MEATKTQKYKASEGWKIISNCQKHISMYVCETYQIYWRGSNFMGQMHEIIGGKLTVSIQMQHM